MDRLIDLVEELVEAIERRESAEPDMAAWEAEADIRRIQKLLLREYRQTARALPEDDYSSPLIATH
jgi:hypothetical protein